MDFNNDVIYLDFLGTGSAISRGKRYHAGILVNSHILVDVPPQTYNHLKILDIPPETLTHIILTHYHPDHMLGLPMLALDWLETGIIGEPVYLVGPPGLEEVITRLLDASFGSGSGYDYSSVFRFYPLPEEGGTHMAGDLAIEAFPMKHSKMNFAYRITMNDQTVSFTGDTGYTDSIEHLFPDSMAVVSEMTTITDSFPTHMNFVEHLPRLSGLLRPGQKLFLCHLAFDTPEIFRTLEEMDSIEGGKLLEILESPDVIIAEDLKRYKVRIRRFGGRNSEV